MGRVFLSLLVLVSALGYGQKEDSVFIKKISDDILVNGRAYESLRTLCKTVGGRLAGSPQMKKAEEWGMQALKEAGADRVYLQECMVPHWMRGGKDEASITYTYQGKQVKAGIDVLALGNSKGTGANGISAPVMLVHNFDELEKRKNEVKGKIVFYNYPFDPTLVQPFEAYRESGIYRRNGPSRAAAYGAVAVLTRSLSGSTDNNPHTGATTYDSTLPQIPAAAVGLRDADKLSQLLASGVSVRVTLRTMAQFLPDVIGHNVIAEWKGREFPDEVITVGGHLDSWDVAEGANDDGSGCVQSIEVLRVLKTLGYKPRRTIRVVLFANEENGLRGGNRYAAEAVAKNEKHLFALESDAGSFTPRGFNISVKGDSLNYVRSWLTLFAPYGVSDFTDGGGGSDVGPLNRLMGTVVSELRPDEQRYFDYHHARNDVFENVNRRELLLGAVNMTALIYLVDKYGFKIR